MDKKTCAKCGEFVDIDRQKCPHCFSWDFVDGASEETASIIKAAAQIKALPQKPASLTTEELLAQVNANLLKIEKSTNRTTHAVRAFVRFLFIQLTATAIAYLPWTWADESIDQYKCIQYGSHCDPNTFLTLLGAGIFVVGIVLSSRAGWSELAKSDSELI